jgi:hypothetical protein
METLIVKVKDETELKLVSDIMKKMKINIKLLSSEEQEDIGLMRMMKELDRSQKVPREKVMAKLGFTDFTSNHVDI